MLKLDQALLAKCIVHLVGNKNRDEKARLSKKELRLDDGLQQQLKGFFLRNFKGDTESWQFSHDVKLKMNEVYTLADNLFEEENFVENSGMIATHLFNQTRNPAIKSGELFVALFEELEFQGTICDAVGIFKSEKKDSFFRITESGRDLDVVLETGIHNQKLDKGCLILNDSYHEGYRVFCYEHNNADTEYWRTDFLGIVPKQDSYQQTKNALSLCRDFVKEKFGEEFDASKAQQIDLLNKSVEYFKNNETFRINDFANEVLEEPEIIDSFKRYKKVYEKESNSAVPNSFDISSPAVKKQAKIFKSILKLDKNFHVYIHGDRSLIEQGIEKDGRKFYKIYYEYEM